MRISLCMIVKNEEEVLRECLESVKGIVSEIVAVDTGSTDRTLSILEEYGARIRQIQWTGDFSEARNASLELATGSHILVLDADERLLSTKEELDTILFKNPNAPYQVLCINDLDGETSTHPIVRLFPNDSSYRYKGTIHESIYKDGKSVVGLPSSLSIWHVGYQKERYQKRNKKEFYLNLYQNELKNQGESGYLLYQTGKLLYSVGEYQEALPYFERCISIGEKKTLYYPVMLVMYGYALRKLDRSMEAQELLVEYIDLYPDFPDLFFLLGLLAMDTGLPENVELAFSQCIAIGETTKYASVSGVGTYKAYHNLAVFYEVTGHLEEATALYRKAGELQYAPSIERLKILDKICKK